MTWIRRGLVALGMVVLAYAVVNALRAPVELPHVIRYLLVVWLGHDLVVMPAAVAFSALTVWLVPRAVRPYAQAALYLTLVVTVVALPMLLGFGRPGDNPSALPRDYTGGYLLVLAAVWAGTAAVAGWRLTRGARDPGVDGPGRAPARPAGRRPATGPDAEPTGQAGAPRPARDD